jgi:hypothetical protein
VEEELGRFQIVQLNTTGKEEDEEEEGKVDIYLSLFYTLDIYIFLSFISFSFFFSFLVRSSRLVTVGAALWSCLDDDYHLAACWASWLS